MVDFEAIRMKYRNMSVFELGVKLTGNKKLDQHAKAVFHDVLNKLMPMIEADLVDEVSQVTSGVETVTAPVETVATPKVTKKKATKKPDGKAS